MIALFFYLDGWWDGERLLVDAGLVAAALDAEADEVNV